MNQLEQKSIVTGEITAKFYDQSSLKVWQRALNRFLLLHRDRHPEVMKMYQLGELKQIDKHKNVICNNGFNAVCRRLTGDTTYTGTINKMLLGTGSDTPVSTDTQLASEAYRNATASATASGNIAYLTAYYTENECNGTYTEFGNVIDGADGANTGQLWSYISGLSWVKTNLVVLVVSCKYTFVSA